MHAPSTHIIMPDPVQLARPKHLNNPDLGAPLEDIAPSQPSSSHRELAIERAREIIERLSDGGTPADSMLVAKLNEILHELPKPKEEAAVVDFHVDVA